MKTWTLVVIALLAGVASTAFAQNSAPNPYTTVDGWAKLPDGRMWGSTSAVYPARDGSGNIWVAERCGENSCLGKDDLDTVLLFDPSGKLIRSFGAGMFEWPHGIHVDADDNVWVTDARGSNGRGHQVIKFTAEGKELMRLGTAGISGGGPGELNAPSDVLVAPNGDIFIVDEHGIQGINRVQKFSKDGTFIKQWGQTGTGPGEFLDPHALAMDSQGRLFVGDRKNNRIQIFDQDGKHIASWTQFGRPSGIYIDDDDILYSADSESNFTVNAGWKRGIRIGSVTDGLVTAFIPDPEWVTNIPGTTAAEGVAVDAAGNIYGAEVGPKDLKKYTKK
jgi:DNA-binding beta-propeller fold protein YncE